VVERPIRTPADVARVHEPNEARTRAVAETVRLLRAALPPEKAVIGFSAAPFTLAAYLIDGGTSRDYAETRAFAARHPAAFRDLLGRISRGLVPYLAGQAEAGADALQLFDTWAGVLPPALWRDVALPAIAEVVDRLGPARPPVILFAGLGMEARLGEATQCGVEALSVDWRTDLRHAYATVGRRVALQGNLDPTVLLADPDTIRRETRAMLDAVPPGRAHLANLGHGILKETPPEHAAAFVEAVRAFAPAAAPR
jgi:uroporphyrinogen decarboxylase